MESSEFINKLYEHFLHEPLTLSQESEYLQRINNVEPHKRREWYSAVLETCKRFPTIADLAATAKALGVWSAGASQEPHQWVPSDCRMCRGSGMTAAFWEQEFSKGEGPPKQILRLQSVTPYQESAAKYRENPEWIRTIYRCDCISGEAKTLPKGWPRWGPNQPMVRERVWG